MTGVHTVALPILVPVVYTASISNVLIVNPKMPASTGAELLKLLKDNPGKYTFASSGVGSSTHMSGELFKSMAQVDLMHVPYKGSGQALVDLIGGQVDMIFDNAPSALPMVQSGQVKRSEERRVGEEGVSTCRSRGSPY